MDTTEHVLKKLKLYLIGESKSTAAIKIIQILYLFTTPFMIFLSAIYTCNNWWNIERQPAILVLFVFNIVVCAATAIVSLKGDSSKSVTVCLILSILAFFSSFSVSSLLLKDLCWDGRFNIALLATMVVIGIIMNLNSISNILYCCDKLEWSANIYWKIHIICSSLACTLFVLILIFHMYWSVFNLLWLGWLAFGVAGIQNKIKVKNSNYQSLLVSIFALVMFFVETNAAIMVYGWWIGSHQAGATCTHAFLSVIPLCFLIMEITCYTYKKYKMSWKKHIFDTNVLGFLAVNVFQQSAKGTDLFTKMIRRIGFWQVVISVIATAAAYFRYHGRGIVIFFAFTICNGILGIFAGGKRWLALIVVEILSSILTVIADVTTVYSEMTRIYFSPHPTLSFVMVTTAFISIPILIFNIVFCAASLHSPLTEEIKSLSFQRQQLSHNECNQPFNLPQVVDRKSLVIVTTKTVNHKDPLSASFFTPLLSNNEYPVKENNLQQWEI